MDFENDLKELEKLEDKDIEKKVKVKKDHKIDPDDIFYRFKLTFNNYSKICKIKNPDLTRGTYVIVPTQYGNEIGIIQGRVTNMDEILSQDELFPVSRIATQEDINKFKSNLKKAKNAYEITLNKIKEHNLDMKLINVHYFLEDQKILFNFTSDGRIDFRELVKDLASIFKTRIELRQIGVRDECRIINGYGQCGKHFCCANVISELEPITIKMAKEQNLTLNSLKISGTCGRLLCCLSYEYQTYLEEKKMFPETGTKIKIENELFEVTEINIQTRNIKLTNSNGERFLIINLDKFKYDEVKKNWILKEKIEI